MKHQFGFTLIEMLFVLSIFLIIISISAALIRPQYLMVEKERFYSQLKSDLLYAQQYAISRQQPVVVYLRPQENKYLISENLGGNLIVEREFSKAIEFGQGTLKPIFQFGNNGFNIINSKCNMPDTQRICKGFLKIYFIYGV